MNSTCGIVFLEHDVLKDAGVSFTHWHSLEDTRKNCDGEKL